MIRYGLYITGNEQEFFFMIVGSPTHLLLLFFLYVENRMLVIRQLCRAFTFIG